MFNLVSVSLHEFPGCFIAGKVKQLFDEGENRLEYLVMLNILRVIVTERRSQLLQLLVCLGNKVLQVRYGDTSPGVACLGHTSRSVLVLADVLTSLVARVRVD